MKSAYVKTVGMAALVTVGILPAVGQAQLIDLGATTGYALNNSGQAALASGIYGNGAVTPLPALPGSTTPATPIAINASGQVAGSGYIGPANGCVVPVEYTGGTLINILGPDTCVGADPNVGNATGINSSGTVIGAYQAAILSHGDSTAFTYSDGTLTIPNVPCTLSAAGVFSTSLCAPGAIFLYGASSINDSGEVVGTITLIDNNEYGECAYLASNGVWTCLGHGTAYAINASGEVTGSLGYDDGSGQVIGPAFLYVNGTTSNLGTLPGGTNSTGYAINATGQIVGSSNFKGSGNATHAFFYNGMMADLNDLISATDPLKPYVTLTSAVGINDSLLILVNGVDSRTNLTHAYLYQAPYLGLTPQTLSFTQTVGGTSAPLSVTVTNTGTAAIPLGTAYVNGNFSLSGDSCGTSLAPGGQCKLEVVFVPTALGVFTGVLTLPSGANSYQVPLSGVGAIAATISASSSTATVGQQLTLTWAATSGSTCIARARSTNSAWTGSTPAFNGTIQPTGKQTLTETVASTMNYIVECTAPDVPPVSVAAQVVWNWPAVTVSISASPTTITAGQSTTLTWTSSNATSCTASGGGPDDNWGGTKPTSGNQIVSEPFALDTASVVLTYVITCNSTTHDLSNKSSVNVTEKQAPASPPSPGGGGGGGALNPLSLALLAGILALRRSRRPVVTPPGR